MSRTCYINKDKREIKLEGYKKYNVNIDVLDFIIDLCVERNNLEERINKAIEYIEMILNSMWVDERGALKTVLEKLKGDKDE